MNIRSHAKSKFRDVSDHKDLSVSGLGSVWLLPEEAAEILRLIEASESQPATAPEPAPAETLSGPLRYTLQTFADTFDANPFHTFQICRSDARAILAATAVKPAPEPPTVEDPELDAAWAKVVQAAEARDEEAIADAMDALDKLNEGPIVRYVLGGACQVKLHPVDQCVYVERLQGMSVLSFSLGPIAGAPAIAKAIGNACEIAKRRGWFKEEAK
jgi:hypothetical protein